MYLLTHRQTGLSLSSGDAETVGAQTNRYIHIAKIGILNCEKSLLVLLKGHETTLSTANLIVDATKGQVSYEDLIKLE